MNIREINFLGSKIMLIHVHKPLPFLAICSSAGESAHCRLVQGKRVFISPQKFKQLSPHHPYEALSQD